MKIYIRYNINENDILWDTEEKEDIPKDTVYFKLISNNFDKTIFKDIFKDLVNLKELYLNYYTIETLDKDIFKNLEKLEILELSDNKINFLDINIFKNLSKLKKLNLSFNPYFNKRILTRRRIYLLAETPPKGLALSEVCESKVGTLKELSDFPTKGTPKELSEYQTKNVLEKLSENSYRCLYCNKNIKSIFMLNYRKVKFLNNNFTSYTCC